MQETSSLHCSPPLMHTHVRHRPAHHLLNVYQTQEQVGGAWSQCTTLLPCLRMHAGDGEPAPRDVPHTTLSRFLPTSRRLVQFSNGRVAPEGARIVYIDGAFDAFHPGHVKILEVRVCRTTSAWKWGSLLRPLLKTALVWRLVYVLAGEGEEMCVCLSNARLCVPALFVLPRTPGP